MVRECKSGYGRTWKSTYTKSTKHNTPPLSVLYVKHTHIPQTTYSTAHIYIPQTAYWTSGCLPREWCPADQVEEMPGRASLEKFGCRTPPQLHAGGVGRQQQHKEMEKECYEEEVQPYQKTDYKPIIYST